MRSGSPSWLQPTENNAVDERPCLLVCEDEPAIRTILASKFEQAGWRVVSATQGEEGLKLAAESPPRLIITDLEMPILDGLAMARRLHEAEATRAIPILLLTARGHRIAPHDLTGTNVVQVVMKPFSMRQLIALVTELGQIEVDRKGRRAA